MNRSMLKAQARDRIAHATPRPLQVGIVFTVIVAILSFFSYKLVSEDAVELYMKYFETEDVENFSYQEFMENFDFDEFSRELDRLSENSTASFLDTLVTGLILIIGSGMSIFCLNTLKGRDASCWNLFDGFTIIGRLLLLYLLECIFIFLWSMLFIIPGIIAAYRYRQAFYLLVEHPEMSPMACIHESSRIMQGHKWELFLLDMSFIGWLLLIYLGNSIGLAFGFPVLGYIIGIWFFPFSRLTYAGFYRSLVGDDIPVDDGWTPEL